MKSFTVLKLNLEDGVDATLRPIGLACRMARNAGTEDWLLRQRGLPESDRQAKSLIARKDKAVDAPKSESTKIYHAMRAAVPALGSLYVAVLSQSVSSYLGARVDWRRSDKEDGKPRRRREAILEYEDRPPFFTTLEIPLPNTRARVVFGDRLTIVVAQPMEGVPTLRLEVSLRDLPPGKQRLMREVATGQRDLPDSKLVEKDGKWFWHVPLTFETEVRSENVAELWPTLNSAKDGKQSDRPFRLELPGRTRPWFVGDGRYLVAQTARLIAIRKQVGWRYQQRMGAGHGRQKIDAAVRRRRTQERNMRTEVLRRAIADVVRQCVRENCGRLIYHEPSLPLREKCWFAAMGLEWNWTKFAADLKNAAARQGIEVEKKQWKIKEALPNGKTKDVSTPVAV